METGQERASILRPILIVAGMIIILAAIKLAASIPSLFFLAAFLAISFMPGPSPLGGMVILKLYREVTGTVPDQLASDAALNQNSRAAIRQSRSSVVIS